MSNVLPIQEQKRVWAIYRQRFISLGSRAFSILAVIAILTLSPSYLMLMLNQPDTPAVKAQSASAEENTEAEKTQALIATLLPMVAATTSAMEVISAALDGRPDGIVINRIAYTADTKQKTIILGGTAQTREGINALRKVLEAKGIYKSVSIPVGDLIGATGNQFTVTLVTNY